MAALSRSVQASTNTNRRRSGMVPEPARALVDNFPFAPHFLRRDV